MNNENYIDYTIEEEVNYNKKSGSKNYPLLKIIAMVLGIIGGLGYIYFSIKNVYQPYMDQFEMIKEYAAMGMKLGFVDMLPYYISMFVVAIAVLAPIVGSLLPIKYKSTSIILIMLPFAWQTIDILPALVLYIAQGTPISELLVYIIIVISSMLCLTSAILTASAKAKKDIVDEEFEVEYFEEYDTPDEETELDEEALETIELDEEIIEAIEKDVDELFDEVKEEIKEDKE